MILGNENDFGVRESDWIYLITNREDFVKIDEQDELSRYRQDL
jgi:hypothetical protein